MDKHERIWGWFDTIAEMDGGWEEFDEPVRRALAEIEQLPGLPDDFAIPYIKLKEGVGIRIEFDNAGDCDNAVWDIVRRVEAETWPLMIQRNQPKGSSIGKSWAEVRREIFTPEEIAEVDARIDRYIEKFGLEGSQADAYRENYWKWEIREREQENRRKAWKFALSMIRMDELEPAPEFMDLIEKEIRGEISDTELLAYIKKTYGAADGSITETLVGVLQHDYDEKEIRAEKVGRYAYPAVFTYEDGQEIAVVFPDLDVATSGINVDDALLSARELLECVLHSLAEDGEPFPIPTASEAISVEQNERAILVEAHIAGEPLPFHSSLSTDEIEKNFEGVDICEGIMAGLEEALEYSREPNEGTQEAMEAAEHDENMHGPFDTVEEMMAALEAEDEDKADLAAYHAAMDEYVRSGRKSSPIEELWKEMGLNESFE